MPSTDSDLVARARQRDQRACHEMVDRYSNYLYRLAFSLVGNADDAADVLQETFSGAFHRLKDFEGRSSIRTWLSRILVRQAARFHRKNLRRRMLSLDGMAENSPEPAAGASAAPTSGSSDARIDLAAALAALSPDHRQVLVLRELQGMSYEEIAEVLGVPRGTIDSRLFRARQELRQQLGDYAL